MLIQIDISRVSRHDADFGNAERGLCTRLEPWWSVIDVYNSDDDGGGGSMNSHW